MKAPTPSNSILERRKRTLPSIVAVAADPPLWTPGHEFVPSSARPSGSARPSAVPSLPPAPTPSFAEQCKAAKEQFRDKLSSLGLGRREEERLPKGERPKPESWRAGRPRRKAVMTAAEALGRTEPATRPGAHPTTASEGAQQETYFARVVPGTRQAGHVHSVLSPGPRSSAPAQGRFSPTIRRPLSTASPLSPFVHSPSGGPPRSVLLPRSPLPARSPLPTRASMPPKFQARARVSMPPPGLPPPSTQRARASMPPSSATGTWALGSQGPPPQGPWQGPWQGQGQGHAPPPCFLLSERSAYAPSAVPAFEPPHSPYPHAHGHHQQPQTPDPTGHGYGYAAAHSRGPVGEHVMSPNPASPHWVGPFPMPPGYTPSGCAPHLPPMPPMSPMGPFFEQTPSPAHPPPGFEPQRRSGWAGFFQRP